MYFNLLKCISYKYKKKKTFYSDFMFYKHTYKMIWKNYSTLPKGKNV